MKLIKIQNDTCILANWNKSYRKQLVEFTMAGCPRREIRKERCPSTRTQKERVKLTARPGEQVKEQPDAHRLLEARLAIYQ